MLCACSEKEEEEKGGRESVGGGSEEREREGKGGAEGECLTSTPAEASNKATAPSTTHSERSTSKVKST